MSEQLRLFLVDDSDIANHLRQVLEKDGQQVTICHTGTDALIVLGHGPFDLVLLEQRLPDMTGLELLHTLGKEGIGTPVLMVTADGDQQLAAQVLHAGALDYLVKDPAGNFLAELPQRVRAAVTRHRLQQTDRLLLAALEATRDGIMITDLQGTILEVNPALARMFGYQRRELLGQNPRLFKSGRHGEKIYEEMWNAILARSSWQGEIVNRRQDGTLLDTWVTLSPIVDGRGQLTHFVGIYRDISQRKQMEQQLVQAQKMQSVGTLAGGIAHEFNNLLTGIQGYATLTQREEGLSAAARQFLGFIVELSERAARLTRQLLAFARQPALSRQPTPLENVLRASAELVHDTLGVAVQLEIQPCGADGPLSALADAQQLQQVLVNLALNARDALTGPAPIRLRLRRQVLAGELPAFPENVPPGDYVLLEVEDRGRGMTPEVLAQALDPFFTTRDVGQGTGLGLPAAYGIMQGHQGFLTLRSQPQEGTCVGLYLPRLAAAPTEPEVPAFAKGQILEPEPFPGRNILVVDDETAVLDVVRRFLEIAGHTVTCATSGRQALELLSDGRPVDLVILDLMIPREEGQENFHRLRQRLPGLPILLCTGLLQGESALKLLSHQAVHLLRKPFRMNELWYAVNITLQSR